MESIKEKIPMIIGTIIAVVILAGVFYFVESYEAIYYTKIDPSKVETISATDEMKYQYTLDCYNEKGKKRELSFKTSRELKEGAYLQLEVRIMGVHKWKEVSISELPQKVKTHYEQ